MADENRTQTYEILQCSHCGNIANLNILAKYSKNFQDPNDLPELEYRILSCPKCRKVVFDRSIYDYVPLFPNGVIVNHPDYEVDKVEYETLYPKTRLKPDSLPTPIRKEYASIQKIRFIDTNACAVLIGRTLEAVCILQQGKSPNLAEMIANLAKSGKIPGTLAQMADQLRIVRNYGAHFSEIEISNEEIALAIDFLDAILEYLYVAPAQVQTLKERLEAAKAHKQEK